MNTARSNTPADQREKDLEAGLVAIGRPPTACAEQTNTGHQQHERPHATNPLESPVAGNVDCTVDAGVATPTNTKNKKFKELN